MKNALSISAVGATLALLVVVAPAATFAKGHGRANPKAHVATETVCPTKAYGHLVAPGWIKKNGAITASSTCKLPPGIGMKLGFVPRPGTTTPDTTAPSITAIVAQPGTSTATVSWMTNEPADSQIAYGTTTAYGYLSPLISTLGTVHAVTLSGLASSTMYHFQVLSRDASTNLATSSDQTFTTTAPSDTTAPILSAISVSGIGSTTATVSWTTNEPATSKVYFASGSVINLATASSVANPTLLTTHALILGGLTASTTYSYVIQSQDASGNTATSSPSLFATTL